MTAVLHTGKSCVIGLSSISAGGNEDYTTHTLMMKFPWLFNDVFFKSKDIVLVNKIATVNPDDHDQIIIVLI